MLRKLVKWLRQPGNTHAKLAELMGYESRSTISNWVLRGRIPIKAQKKLKEVLNVQESSKKTS